MIEHKALDQSEEGSDDLIEIGEIKAVYGVKGWVKVFSYTRPIEQIYSYKNWLVGSERTPRELETGDRRSNSGLIAKLKGVDDRDAASLLMGEIIAIRRSDMAELGEDEYYWSQLIGLDVFNTQSDCLGRVTDMLETGANDVLVVSSEESERLIPYADSIVIKVDLDGQRIVVDWDTDF